MTNPRNGTWLITGCSSGIGAALAREVLDGGGRVAAIARRSAPLDALAQTYGDRVIGIVCDIADQAQCAAAAAKAESTFGSIDVLVNNAGRGLLGALEEASDSEARAVFDTNLFGAAALIRAVLPGMRARRQGVIVNVSSIGGVIGSNATGWYCASKFALEGLSEALAHEVAEFGIRVMIVQPGAFRTGFPGGRIQAEKAIPAYTATAARRHSIATGGGNSPGDPARGAAAIVNAVASDAPPLRLLLGGQAWERAIGAYDARKQEALAWRDMAFGTDYPAE